MDPRTESIKQEVDQTLEDMAEKMEQIESRVYGAARETVQNVKEKFDVRHLTAEHPWTMLGASVAVGFLAGNIRRSESRRSRRLAAAGVAVGGGRQFSYEHSDDPYEQSEDEGYGMTEMVHVSGYERGTGGYGEEASGYRQGAGGYGQEERHPSREIVRRSISRVSSRVKASAPGLLSSLKEHFGDEIEALKKAALITVGNSLSGLIHKNMPQFAQEFDRVRQDGGQEGAQGGWQQSQQRTQGTQGWSQGQGESRQGSESRYGGGSQYGSEGRYGSGNQYGGEYQGQSERYGSQGQQGQGRSASQGQGEGRYGNQGQQRYGSQGQGETRYGGQGQQGQGRSGSQGQGEGRYGGQQARGYNPESPNVGSSADSEYGSRESEGGYGTPGHPSGRKSHN